PAKITVARVAQTVLRDALETTASVEACGKLVGERLVMDEAIGPRQALGALVEIHRLERAAFQPGDLRADQRGAVSEILRAMLRQDFELTAAARHCLEVPFAFAGLGGIAGSGVGKRGEEAVLRPREFRRLGPEQLVRVCGRSEGRSMVARKEARLQFPDPPPARRKRMAGAARDMALELL